MTTRLRRQAIATLLVSLLALPGMPGAEEEDRWWEQPPGDVQPGDPSETPWWQRPPGAGLSTTFSVPADQVPVASAVPPAAETDRVREKLQSPEWQAQHSAMTAEQRQAMESRLKELEQDPKAGLKWIYSPEGIAATELMARDQLTAAQQTFGEDHPQTLSARGGLAHMLQSQEKWAEAEEQYRRLLQAYEQQDGSDSYGALAVLPGLIEALRQQGKVAEAIAMENKLQALRLQRDQLLEGR
jgi:tetratricopeptide (TPR) repeat protein